MCPELTGSCPCWMVSLCVAPSAGTCVSEAGIMLVSPIVVVSRRHFQLVYLIEQLEGRVTEAEYASLDCLAGRLVVVRGGVVVELDRHRLPVKYEGHVECVVPPPHLPHEAPLLQVP